jgi:hypothetical protein
MISWQTNWKAHGWAMPAGRADSILAYCADKCRNVTTDEMDAALESVCAALESGKSQAPTMRTIVARIWEARNNQAGIDTGMPFPVRQAEGHLATAPADGLARWEIVCRIAGDPKVPNAGTWAEHLANFARRLVGGLTVPYWGRRHGTRVIERDAYMAALAPDVRARYVRMGESALGTAIQGMAFEGRIESLGANRRHPGGEG